MSLLRAETKSRSSLTMPPGVNDWTSLVCSVSGHGTRTFTYAAHNGWSKQSSFLQRITA